jgi:hypothetical protein
MRKETKATEEVHQLGPLHHMHQAIHSLDIRSNNNNKEVTGSLKVIPRIHHSIQICNHHHSSSLNHLSLEPKEASGKAKKSGFFVVCTGI